MLLSTTEFYSNIYNFININVLDQVLPTLHFFENLEEKQEKKLFY